MLVLCQVNIYTVVYFNHTRKGTNANVRQMIRLVGFNANKDKHTTLPNIAILSQPIIEEIITNKAAFSEIQAT